MNQTVKDQSKIEKFRKLIVVLSVIIPLAVAALFGIKVDGVDLSFLPPVYAGINGATAIVLISALIAIKNKKIGLHQSLMKLAMVFSLLFLVMYVAYHMTSESTEFGGEGTIKYIYYFILISHILLSIGVVPLVLFTFLRGWAGDYVRHKKLARIAFPIWLYVAITGVVVYVMISPYYS